MYYQIFKVTFSFIKEMSNKYKIKEYIMMNFYINVYPSPTVNWEQLRFHQLSPTPPHSDYFEATHVLYHFFHKHFDTDL